MPSRDFSHIDVALTPRSGESAGNRRLVPHFFPENSWAPDLQRAGTGSPLRKRSGVPPRAPRPGNVASGKRRVRGTPKISDQRLENWNERRALARPYFLRSTTRESRVRKPLLLST